MEIFRRFKVDIFLDSYFLNKSSDGSVYICNNQGHSWIECMCELINQIIEGLNFQMS